MFYLFQNSEAQDWQKPKINKMQMNN